LQRLAQTLSPFISVEWLNELLEHYQFALMKAFGELMRGKLGLLTEQTADNDLLTELFALMTKEGSDYTRTFRMLSLTEQHSASSPLRDEFIDRASFDSWFTRYRARLQTEQISDEQRQQTMKAANPSVVLRNWLAQRAIDAAEQGDVSVLAQLHETLKQPFAEHANEFTQRPPDWGKRLEVSCSS
jgi:hypothetical protein